MSGATARDSSNVEVLETGLLELLLGAMAASFVASPHYRRHLQGFDALYVLGLEDGAAVTVHFGSRDGHGTPNMIWERGVVGSDHDATITFKDERTLVLFLLAPDGNVLEPILNNDIDLQGNLNYVFKFCFMVRDLEETGQRDPVVRKLGASFRAAIERT
jgi:hypothetical protein